METDFFSPCIRSSGPSPARIALVGEAPGQQEELMGVPFVGKSGQELTAMLQESGIHRAECYLTNVIFTRPPGNKFDEFLIPKKETPPGYSLPPVKPGKYLHPSLLPELERLKSELAAARPNLTIALGNTATWALLGAAKISSIRGTIAPGTLVPGLKVLPTYHPAGVLRNWSWRVIVLQDLLKAKREMEFPEIRRIERRIIINPSYAVLVKEFCEAALSAPMLSCDIETEKGQITSISFSVSPDRAFVIPFWDKRKESWSYWSQADEQLIWHCIHRLLSAHPRVLFQNGLYDIQYIWGQMGIPIPGFCDDTMLLHHSMFPELPKSLEFLGSIYTNEISWKKMRQRHGAGETKRDE